MPPLLAKATSIPAPGGAERTRSHSSSVKAALVVMGATLLAEDASPRTVARRRARQRAAARAADDVDDQERAGERGQEAGRVPAAAEQRHGQSRAERAEDADERGLPDRHRVAAGEREPCEGSGEQAAEERGDDERDEAHGSHAYPVRLPPTPVNVS